MFMTTRKHRRLMTEEQDRLAGVYRVWIEAHQAMMVQLGITTTKLNIHLRAIRRMDIEEYEKRASEVLADADRGQPTAIIGRDGRVVMTVGFDGRDIFPKPDPDPLEGLDD